MRKSNHVFSDPTDGGILNLNKLQSKPSGSPLNIGSLLLSTLCCINSKVPFDFDKPNTLLPVSPAPALAPAPPAFKPLPIQKEVSLNEFKKFI